MSTDLDSLLTGADSYFQEHLDSASWFALPEARRKGALSAAAADVESRLGEFDSTDSRQTAAAFEQALHLASATVPRSRELVQESVEGLGSKSWQIRSGGNAEFAPRALRLIEQIERERRFAPLERG